MADRDDGLAARFESNRAHLRAVAYRMLGSVTEAEDAVQEVWLRLDRASRETAGETIDNLRGWLTTVVARLCLDQLRARTARREELLGDAAPGPPDATAAVDPEREALLADAVGPALLVVLAQLAPAERIAFVLHDMFAVPFEEIAPIVGRNPDATRQLASRARRRVQGRAGGDAGEADHGGDVDRARAQAVVAAFLAASRSGNLEALVAVLDPAVVVRADGAAAAMGAEAEVRGVAAVAKTFAGRAAGARAALVDGAAGAVWSAGGKPRVVFAFTIAGDRIVALELRADPTYLEDVAIELTPT